MRKKIPNILLSTVLALSIVGSGQATAATNLIQNGGFEGPAAGGSGANWSFGTIGNTPQSLQAAVTGEDPFEGSQAQILAEDGASLAGDNLRIISDSYPVVPNEGLSLSFKSKVVNMTDASLNYAIVFYDSSDVQVGEVSGTPRTTATSGYSDFNVKAAPPAGATNFKVRFDSIILQDGGSYKLFIDAVEVTSTANTVPVSGDTQVGIIGGELEFYISPGAFSDVQLDYNKAMTSQTSSQGSIVDNTGEARGWKLKMSSTDFVSEDLEDASGSNATIVLKLPASSMTLQTKNITRVSGQPIDPTHGPNAENITLGSSARTILSSDPGFGSGSYMYDLENNLTIPKTLEVINATGDGSIQVGQMVGTRKGTYKATVNFVAGVGL